MPPSPSRFNAFLRWTERYTKTDMVYLFSGGSWLFVGQIFSLLFSLALAIAFGHYATQDTYGNYKYILSLGGILGILSLSGLTPAVGRAVAHGEEGALAQGFSLSLRYSGGILVAGILVAGYYWLQGNIFVAASMLLVAALSPFINAFSLYDSFLSGKLQFKTSVFCMFGSLAVTTIALIVTLLYFSQRAIVLVAVYFITNLVTDALWYFVTIRRTKNGLIDPELKSYGAHLSVLNVLDAITNRIDTIVVFTLLGPAQLAIYSYAIALPEQFRGVVANLGKLTLPKFAGRPIEIIRTNIIVRLFALTAAIALIMAAYAVCASFLFDRLFPIYLESVPFSRWYVFAVIPTGISTVLIALLQAHKKTRALYIVTNIGFVILIISLPILTYLWGISGTIISVILSRTMLALAALWQFYTTADAKPPPL